MLPEIQDLKIQVAKLEKEKEELKESLESTQAEVEGLKEQASVTAGTLKRKVIDKTETPSPWTTPVDSPNGLP